MRTFDLEEVITLTCPRDGKRHPCIRMADGIRIICDHEEEKHIYERKGMK